jgi:ribosomal protein L35AE/L33A
MTILHIEHRVPNFAAWKQAFDSDPVGRQQAGVRRYWVTRPHDDPDYAIIDLEFDTREQAEDLLARMRVIWQRVQGTIVVDPQVRLSDVVEYHEF